MGIMQKIAIVIPCYNEAYRICPDAFIDYDASDSRVHFIFVNDCSTDHTSAIINKLAKDYPARFSVVHLENNLGKAGAVRQGFLKAFSADFEAIGFWDADLATPLAEIEMFIEKLETSGIDIVIGSRVRLLGRPIERRAVRHYLGRIFATVASLVLGETVYDTQCGAKLFRNTKTLKQVFSEPFTVNWIFDIEILARYILQGRIEERSLGEFASEYPLQQWKDVAGSKLKGKDFLISAVEIIKIAKLMRKL